MPNKERHYVGMKDSSSIKQKERERERATQKNTAHETKQVEREKRREGQLTHSDTGPGHNGSNHILVTKQLGRQDRGEGQIHLIKVTNILQLGGCQLCSHSDKSAGQECQ